MSDYADLIRGLREAAKYLFERHRRGCESLGVTHDAELEECIEWKAADAIEALVNERDTALRDGERIGLEMAAKWHEMQADSYEDKATYGGSHESEWSKRYNQKAENERYAATAIRALITQEQGDAKNKA